MKVVDLHPEDLLDKEAHGELTEAESARLDAHLARCSTCRFEREARADFASELQEEHVSVQRLLALLEGVPAVADDAGSPPLLVGTKVAEPPSDDALLAEEPKKTPSVRPSRGRRARRVALLAFAAVLVGGAATAGGGAARVWERLSAAWSEPTIEASPRAAPAVPSVFTSPTALAAQRVRPAEEEAVTETAPVAEVVTPVAVRSADPPVESAAMIFDAANEARRQGDYARAITLHRRLQAAHPKSREAHVSQATMGRLLLDRGDAASALSSFDAYQARGPGALDEAVMVGRATSLERLGRADEARETWRALLATFPETPYAEHARARIEGARVF